MSSFETAIAAFDAGDAGTLRSLLSLLVVSGRVSRECGVQLDLIDVLVDGGADPNCLDPALAHRENAAAERLLERGAHETLVASVCLGRPYDLTDSSLEQRQAALAGAALHGRADALRDLIAAGVDVNAFNPDAWHSHSTALHSAVDSGDVGAMQVLVDGGADLAIKDTLFDAAPRGWAEYLGRPHPFTSTRRRPPCPRRGRAAPGAAP